jgi:hypothetical protein
MCRVIVLFLAAVVPSIQQVQASEPVDALCQPLLEFVSSVRPGDTRAFALHTIWGTNFNDAPGDAIFAKRCEDDGYAPAQKLCRYFIPNSAAEFAGSNVKRTLLCLSPGSRIVTGLNIERGTFSLTYKSAKGENLVTIEFDEDRKIGGMALRVVSQGD